MKTATPKDLAAIDRMINPQEPKKPPERIYNWLNSQLSIARYYGGCTFQEHRYHIAPNEEGQPLVRADVLQREAREKADKLKADRKAQKLAAQQAQQAQGNLL